MQTADLAAKLAPLHDIVAPAPVPWWPAAPGWYAIAALAAAIVAWALWRAYRGWRANAYRRIALRRLASIRAQIAAPAGRPSAVPALAELLRRAALHVAPRERVAALSGDAWLAFLDAGIGGTAFRGGTGRLLLTLPYQSPAAIARIPRADLDALCVLVGRWLRAHRAVRVVSEP